MTGSLPAYAGVLFDCDGVLVDSEAITNGVLHDMLHELGWPTSRDDCLRLFVGHALKDRWQIILDHTGFRIDEGWIEMFRDRRDVGLREGVTAIDGVTAALDTVHAAYGTQTAVASGADRKKIEMQLSLTGLAPFFGDRVYSGMEQPRSKPAPDVYLAAATGIRIDPGAAAVVEDTVPGVSAGVAAGATVIGYSPNVPHRTAVDALYEAGATHVIDDMRDLPPLLLR